MLHVSEKDNSETFRTASIRTAKMRRGGKKAAPPRLTTQLLPVLSKPLSAVGLFVEIQGSDWGGCPAADKDKWFKCIVRQFEAVHNFPGGTKSAHE